MKKIVTMILSMILVLQPLSTYAAVDVARQPFSDIKGHWAEQTINKHYKMGMLKGYLDGTFKPKSTINRAEIMTMIEKDH